MGISKSIWAVAGAGAALFVSVTSPAFADRMICNDTLSCSYDIDVWHGKHVPPDGPWGTVGLKQVGSNVDVTIRLSGSNYFSLTGPGQSFLWDFARDPNIGSDVVLTGSSAGKFAFLTNYRKKGADGLWDYGLACIACGNTATKLTSLTFEIRNATLGEFVENRRGRDFSLDIGVCKRDGKCRDGTAYGESGQNQIPEPPGILLLGSGLLAWTAYACSRKKAGACA